MTSKGKPLIDGDLDKPFWREQDPNRYGFHLLSDMLTGEKPEHVETRVSFRWINDNSSLIVGIECMEPKMDRLREACKTADSPTIFADDMVEIRLETAVGIRPLIGVNLAGIEPEHYMLSPSGTNFREPTCMGNIFVRK